MSHKYLLRWSCWQNTRLEMRPSYTVDGYNIWLQYIRGKLESQEGPHSVDKGCQVELIHAVLELTLSP